MHDPEDPQETEEGPGSPDENDGEETDADEASPFGDDPQSLQGEDPASGGS